MVDLFLPLAAHLERDRLVEGVVRSTVQSREFQPLLGIGASFEGIFHKHMVLPDSIRDSAWYAIVDDDWPAAKALLETKIARHAG
ncbi:MAG: hypothetical protein QOD85_18 [Gaiellaceae bacterium]|nr:hypothetical protein [Gaiellaceae bacterium]